VLEPEEAAEATQWKAQAVCPVSGRSIADSPDAVPVEVGGEIRYLCGANHVKPLNDELIAAEGGGPTGGDGGGDPEPSTWTEGRKKLIIIRVDFPDLGLTFTDASATSMVNNLNNFYTEMSFGRTGFELVGSGSDITPIFRMSNPASYYGTNDYYNQLRSEARAAATAAGYNLGNYNLDVICLGPVPGFGWAGLAYVGAAGAWLRNSFGTGVGGHELGHNYGLNHANYWDTGGKSINGPGTTVEYGDSFDTMGSASAGANHFSSRYKTYLNWLVTNETLHVQTSGTYRISALDNTNSTGVRGLKVLDTGSSNYWVEFRQKFTGNRWMMSGAGLRIAQTGNQKSQLLDTTPGSTDGKNDSALVIGRTFANAQRGVYITPVGKGGTSPESLDVVINLGSFPGNVAPAVVVDAPSSNAAPGVVLSFTAAASDANGDPLAYYWDFGDGFFGSNSPAVTKSWTTTGEYAVHCVVTDMKGGQASDTVIVRIGSPTTYRISGQVTESGNPIEGARVYVSTTRMVYTDSDGTYTLVGLPAGTYTVAASLYPHTLVATSFTNPVVVGPDFAGADFISTTITAPAITTQPQSQSANPGSNVTFSVVATGTQPLRYQWRFNGVSIAGETNAMLTKFNVQATNAGNYSVVASNLAGTVTSGNALLTVNTPPSITTQPQSQSVIAGANVTFSVTASGGSPLYYQWRLNGTNIAGATSSSLTRTNVQLAHVGTYSVVVSNSLGAVTSSSATLSVNYLLSVSATLGGTVTKSPDLPSYAAGSTVTVTAATLSIYEFTGWTGDASGMTNPLAVVMTANKSITAQFASPVPDLVIDNPEASFVGTWATATSANNKYGTNYRTASSSANSPSATATFIPDIGTGGRYDVYVWYPTITKP
jgi:hypothetical protein